MKGGKFSFLYYGNRSETKGERTSRDIFPLITSDTAPRETSFSGLWRGADALAFTHQRLAPRIEFQRGGDDRMNGTLSTEPPGDGSSGVSASEMRRRMGEDYLQYRGEGLPWYFADRE